MYREFDVNVPLCMTTVERCVVGWSCKDGDVRWHKMGLGSKLKSWSTTVDGELAELQLISRLYSLTPPVRRTGTGTATGTT